MKQTMTPEEKREKALAYARWYKTTEAGKASYARHLAKSRTPEEKARRFAERSTPDNPVLKAV